MGNEKNERVSIITPVFNSAVFIAQNIESVLAQTYVDWEHILVDDCSTDESGAIIGEYVNKDERIKYYRLNSNSGAGVARNRAIELAKGRYIAFLDSDDLWYPKKLEKQLAFMKDNNHKFTFTGYDKIDGQGNRHSKIIEAKATITYKSALYKNLIGCLTVVYDTLYFGKQFMPTIRKRQDYGLWLKLLKKTNAYGLNECLSSYRSGHDSISSKKMDLIKYEWIVYRKVEGLSLAKSIFYTCSAILIKLKSYF